LADGPFQLSVPAVGARGLAMFGVILSSYVVNAMDRQIFPLLAPDIRHELGLNLSDMGLLTTILMFGMALAGLPTSFLVVHLGRKIVLMLGIVIFSAGTALSGLADGFFSMALCRALTGVGEAMQITVIIAIAANCFTRFRAASIASVNVAFGVGTMLGPWAGGGILAAQQSWRTLLFAFAALGLPVVLAIAAFVRRWLSEALFSEAGGSGNAGGACHLANRNTILLTAMTLICGLMIYGFLGMYPTYLREVLHYRPVQAGSVMSFYGLGVLLSVGVAWLGDRLPPRPLLGVAFATAALLGILLFSGLSDLHIQCAISFLWGLTLSGVVFPNLAANHVKALSAALTNRATGIFITSFYGAAAVAGFTIGWMADRANWALAGQLQFFSLAVLAVLLALALKPLGTTEVVIAPD